MAENNGEGQVGTEGEAPVIEPTVDETVEETPEEVVEETATEELPEGEVPAEEAPVEEAPEVTEEQIQEEVAEEATGDETPEELKALYQRIKDKYSDREFSEDADYDDAIGEYLDELEGFQQKNTEANEKLVEIFESEPVASEVISDMIEGADFITAVARHIDAADLEKAEGEPNYEQWAKNKETRNERRSQLADFEGSYETNKAASREALTAFQEEKGMDEEQMGLFLDQVDEVFSAVYNGKVTPEFLGAMHTMMNQGDVIASEREAGKIEGRNEQIEVKKQELDTKGKGDGLPQVDGGGEEISEEPVQESYIDRLVRRQNERRAI